MRHEPHHADLRLRDRSLADGLDDERLARNELRRLLTAFPDVEITGEATNAEQAREQLAALKPDLIFLDVQMPGETGMELLESLEPPAPPLARLPAKVLFWIVILPPAALNMPPPPSKAPSPP